MKKQALLLLFTFLVSPGMSFAGICQTYEGFNYECGNTKNMLEAIILNTMEASDNRRFVRTSDGGSVNQSEILRYSNSEDLPDVYFQIYINSLEGEPLYLVHFVKNQDSSYDIYVDESITEADVLSEDASYTSNQVRFFGKTTNLSFSKKGYPWGTIKRLDGKLIRLFSSDSQMILPLSETDSKEGQIDTPIAEVPGGAPQIL